MEPSQTTEQVVPQPHRVNQVTTFSKFLALALIVVLPFLGGYVGYNLGAKTKEVHTPHSNNHVATTTALTTNPESLAQPESKTATSTVSLSLLADPESVLGSTCEEIPPYDNDLVEAPDYYEWFDRSDINNITLKAVCYKGNVLDVDTETFQVIHRDPKDDSLGSIFDIEGISADVDTIGIDKDGLYIADKRVIKSDQEGIAYTYFGDGEYFRFGSRIYTDFAIEIYGIFNYPIIDYVVIPYADAASFEYIDHSYARDMQNVYYGTKVISTDPKNFSTKSLPYAAANTWEAGTIDFGFDSNNVYFNGTTLVGINLNEMYLGAGHRFVADSDTIYFFQFACHGPATPVLGDLKGKDTFDNTSC